MGILISFWFVEKKFLFVEKLPKIDFQEIISTLKEGLPLALNSIAWLVYFKIDVLLIGKMISPANAGLYEIAYKILEVTFILPAVVMAIFFSQLVKTKIIEEYRKRFIQAGASLLGVGLLVASVGIFMLPIVFPWYFRADQLEVVQIFSVLGWAIPFVYLANLTTQTLVIQKQSYHYLAITICGAILNLGLNLVLIPKIGVTGAAIATVGTEFLIMISSLFFVLKRFGCQLDKVDNI